MTRLVDREIGLDASEETEARSAGNPLTDADGFLRQQVRRRVDVEPTKDEKRFAGDELADAETAVLAQRRLHHVGYTAVLADV